MDRELLLKKFKKEIALASVERPKSRFFIGPLSLQIAAELTEGIKSGRMIMLMGKESSGKTTLALDIIARYQKDNPEAMAGWLDFERSFVKEYAAMVGVDLDRLLIVRPQNTERGLMIAEEMIEEAGIKLIVIDSIAAAKPSSEDDKTYEDNMKMASNAGIITRFCNRIKPILDDNDALMVVLNQMRANLNSMAREKEIAYGPKALVHASDLTVALRLKEREDTRITVEALIRKNRVGAPAHLCSYDIVYGKGIDHRVDIFRLALFYDLIRKSGAWYYYGELKAQGEENSAALFPIDELRAKIMQKLQ